MRTLLFTTIGLVVLAALAARVFSSRGGRSAQRRFESLFKKPEKRSRPPASGHYYKRYWE